ncbi:unnamed protein product [Closterium sp. NIES-64]|nr:unnamed protein product [Closterium sp. NIES-64]
MFAATTPFPASPSFRSPISSLQTPCSYSQPWAYTQTTSSLKHGANLLLPPGGLGLWRRWRWQSRYLCGTAPVFEGVGVVLLRSSLLQLLYIWLVRHRIPFSATILKHAVHVVNTFPSVIWVAYLFLLLSLIWTVIWVVGVSGAMALTNAFVVLIILMLSNYWTMEVVRNMVHTAVAGTTTTFYFLRHNMPPKPTTLALHRAATKSFGSVCFGSLLVALIQTLRFIVRAGGSGGTEDGERVAALANNDDGGNFITCFRNVRIDVHPGGQGHMGVVQGARGGRADQRRSVGGVLGLGMFIGGVVAALVGGLLSLNKAVELLAAMSIVSFIISLVLAGRICEGVGRGGKGEKVGWRGWMG